MSVFRERGYENATMRDVADRAGILNGSLYHHFASKEALYAEAHGLALARAAEGLSRQLDGRSDAWDRLKTACTYHLQIQVAPDSMTTALMSELPRITPDLRETLVRQRDDFEQIYRGLVQELPLDPAIDRNLYRTLLLSMINSAPTWFRPGKLSVEAVAQQMLLIFKCESPGAPR